MASKISGDSEGLKFTSITHLSNIYFSSTHILNVPIQPEKIEPAYLTKTSPDFSKLINEELFIFFNKTLYKMKPSSGTSGPKAEGKITENYDTIVTLEDTPKDFMVIEKKFYFLYDQKIMIFFNLGNQAGLKQTNQLQSSKILKKFVSDGENLNCISGSVVFKIVNDTFLQQIYSDHDDQEIADLLFTANNPPLLILKHFDSVIIYNREEEDCNFKMMQDDDNYDMWSFNQDLIAIHNRALGIFSVYEWNNSSVAIVEIKLACKFELEMFSDNNVIYWFNKETGYLLFGFLSECFKEIYCLETEIPNGFDKVEFIFHKNSIDENSLFDNDACIEVIVCDQAGVATFFVKIDIENRFGILYSYSGEPQLLRANAKSVPQAKKELNVLAPFQNLPNVKIHENPLKVPQVSPLVNYSQPQKNPPIQSNFIVQEVHSVKKQNPLIENNLNEGSKLNIENSYIEEKIIQNQFNKIPPISNPGQTAKPKLDLSPLQQLRYMWDKSYLANNLFTACNNIKLGEHQSLLNSLVISHFESIAPNLQMPSLIDSLVLQKLDLISNNSRSLPSFLSQPK